MSFLKINWSLILAFSSGVSSTFGAFESIFWLKIIYFVVAVGMALVARREHYRAIKKKEGDADGGQK